MAVASTGSETCYFREPDGALVGSYDGSLATYYHFDALGSTLLLSDTSGTPVNAFDYTPWGTLNYRYADVGHYQYVGQYGYYDNEPDSDAALTGLLRLGVRFYDPQIGRFTQRDPIDGSVGTNLFAYAEENPLSEIDPSGKKSWRNQLCKWACLGLGTGLCCWMQASCVGVDVVTIGGAAIPCHIAATIFCGAVSGVVSLNCFSACDEYAP